MKKISFLAVLLFVSVFPSSAHASTVFNGTITGDVVWTKTDSPYIVNYVSIPQGASLTMLPGTIVKIIDGSNPFSVEGTLTIGSAGGERVSITSMEDDSIGGDTNGDGPTTMPHAGNWNQVIMHAGSTVTIVNTAVTYGGATPYNGQTGGYFTLALIENNGGVLTIDHTELAHSGYYGIRQFSGTTTITNSTLTHIGNWGMYSTQGSLTVASSTFDTMERGVAASGGTLELRGNTFMHLTSRYAISVDGLVTQFINHGGNSGNGGQSGILLGLSVDGDCTLSKDSLPYIAQYTHVNSGGTLTILPGAIIKVSTKSNPFIVDGTLIVGSAGAERVYITSINDDAVGGDTNTDGTTTVPQAGDWRSILFNPGSVGTITNTSIRYGGLNEYSVYLGYTLTAPMIANDGGALTLTDAVITNGAFSGIKQTSGTTTILNSEIAHTAYGAYVVGGTALIHDSSIHDNSASGISNTTAVPIDATNNYWGDPSGPTHPSNPGGTGDRVSDGVSFAPWLGAWPTTTDPCVGVVNCYSNVLFLPGMMGSRLFEQSSDCALWNGEHERWVSTWDCDQARLALDANGKSINPLYTKEGDAGVIDDAYSFNMYQSFMNDLDTWKNNDHLIADYALIAYDWRFSLEDIIQNGATSTDGKLSYATNQGFQHSYIYQKLLALQKNSRTGKVTIVAHSNGGLVTKALIQKLKETNDPLYGKIDQIIFVAVPQSGTPEAVSDLLHGDQIGPWGFIMGAKRLRSLTQNMPGAYHLLPSTTYFSDITTPIVTFADGTATQAFISTYGHSIANATDLNRFLLGVDGRTAPAYTDLDNPTVLHANLLTYAQGVHQQLDTAWELPPTTKLYQIAGWGEDTLATINYRSVRHCDRVDSVIVQGATNYFCSQWGSQLTFDPNKVIDGDGTVLMPSALAMSTSSERVKRYWVNLGDYNKVLSGNIDRVHKDILEVPELRNLISNIITQTTDISLRYISTSTPNSSNSDRLTFTLHSPLTLEFTDDLGNHIGYSTTTSNTDFKVPGARYERYGDVQLLSILKTATGTLMLHGTASGSFTLDIKEQNGNTTIATTSFEGIISATSTVVTMHIDPSFSPVASGTLAVDEDGNGSVDLSVASKLNAVVTMPPRYYFSGFLQPINDTTVNSAQSPSVFKGGSTIPVKFQLKSASSTPIQSFVSPLWLTPQKLSSMSSASNESSAADAGTNGATFKWDSTNQQYIYNWSTKGLAVGYWYRISAKLDDGSVQGIVVGIK